MYLIILCISSDNRVRYLHHIQQWTRTIPFVCIKIYYQSNHRNQSIILIKSWYNSAWPNRLMIWIFLFLSNEPSCNFTSPVLVYCSDNHTSHVFLTGQLHNYIGLILYPQKNIRCMTILHYSCWFQNIPIFLLNFSFNCFLSIVSFSFNSIAISVGSNSFKHSGWITWAPSYIK